MALPPFDRETWTARTARVGFPILVEFAFDRSPITYTEWDRIIVERNLGHHVLLPQYGRPAGQIGDACIRYSAATGTSVPLINLLIIRGNTRIPGQGADHYIREFCSTFLNHDVDPATLTLREKQAIIEDSHQKIFDFPDWNDVLEFFGLQTVERNAGRLDVDVDRPEPNAQNWHIGRESIAHQNLKAFIASNPNAIGLPPGSEAVKEFRLWSGDEIDVFFPVESLGVEVKTSSAGFDELHRGVFQCIKYKAVLRAQQIYRREIPTADCVLAVGGELPQGLRSVMATFNLRYFEHLER